MILNRRKKFAACRKMTEAYVKTPDCVQDILDISYVWEDGIFEIEKNSKFGNRLRMFDKVYQFQDINYVNKDSAEKSNVLLSVCKLFNSMNMDFKITIVNEPRDLKGFMDQVMPDSSQSEYPLLAVASNELVMDALAKGTPELDKKYYFTVTCRRKSYQHARTYFRVQEASIEAVFAELGSGIKAMDAQERLQMLYHFCHGDGKIDFTYEEILKNRRDWRNEIVPYACNNEEGRIEFGEEYMQVLFVPALPNSVNESKLMSQLSGVSFLSAVTIDCACVPRELLKGFLDAANSNNEVSINKEMEINAKNKNYNAPPSYKKRKARTDIEDYMDQVDENDENGFFMQLLVAVRGKTPEELKENVETIQMLGSGMSVKFVPDYNQQIQAFNTVLPIGARRVDHMRSLLTSSLVAFHPYHARDIIQAGGCFYGVNKLTKNIILLDRKMLKNSNGVIFGHTGSGKSMVLKLTEIGWTLLCTTDDIFAIDPQNELEGIVRLYGGQYFDLTSGSGIYLNPFEVPEDILYADDYKKQTQFVGMKSDFVEAFLYSCMHGNTPNGIHKTLIVRCMKKMYEKVFLSKKPVSPVLSDFVELLKVQPEPEGRELYLPLEAYVDGTFDMFSKQSNLNSTARFVAFGMKNVPTSLWETCMLTVMHLLSMRMEYNMVKQKATRFIVDEGQYVCNNRASAVELEKAFITFRKFGGINTLCLQNVKAAFANPKIETMVSNCDFKLILDQGGADRNALSTIMELSSKEFKELGNPEIGQCLISYGGQILLCDSQISKQNLLYKEYSTNFHEKAKESQGG